MLNDWNPQAKVFAHKHEQTGDPVYAIQSFCLSRQTGEPIEESVLKFLENSFLSWAKAGGVMSLDEIMGINPGKGAKSALRKTWKKQRDKRLFETVAILIELGWTERDALEAACAQLDCKIEDKPSLERRLKPSNAGRDKDPEIALLSKTLRDYWRKRSGDRIEAINRAKTILNFGWTDKQKEEYQKDMRRFIGGK